MGFGETKEISLGEANECGDLVERMLQVEGTVEQLCGVGDGFGVVLVRITNLEGFNSACGCDGGEVGEDGGDVSLNP